ncbi:XRE family transcriptional regulator [Enterococcus sp. HY326]|uniref:XRE family transcriptional regulator n=1 Tax=Enterococcus sp. HY326 TaxID=2971265 RepID=UPI00223F625A|nr:XRE family transcriptional regulator [Enterococcus sp. HY326]
MEENSKEFRNEYNRYVLRLLVNEYYVSRPELAKAADLSLGYVREFDNGTRDFGNAALDQFEEIINTKFEPLLMQHDYELSKVKEALKNVTNSEELEAFKLSLHDMI